MATKQQLAFARAGKAAAKKGFKPGTKAFGAAVKKFLKKGTTSVRKHSRKTNSPKRSSKSRSHKTKRKSVTHTAKKKSGSKRSRFGGGLKKWAKVALIALGASTAGTAIAQRTGVPALASVGGLAWFIGGWPAAVLALILPNLMQGGTLGNIFGAPSRTSETQQGQVWA